MENYSVYEDIANRTGGDIYIGVVGPVRTGKSTFIKRFMELMVLPYAEEGARAVMIDELPQAAAGKTPPFCAMLLKRFWQPYIWTGEWSLPGRW